MSAAATITDQHSVGITTDKAKVGGVVDTLTADTPDGRYQLIPIDLIHEHPRNPAGRTKDVSDILPSIKTLGVTQPIGVCTGKAYNAGRLEDDPAVPDDHYVIVNGGHRRRQAAIEAGLTQLPSIIRDDLADAKGRRAALLENLARKQLDPFEEAEAFAELRDQYSVTQEALAEDVGCSQSHISKRIQLLKLPSTIRASVEVGKMSINDALAFTRIVDDQKLIDEAMTKVTNWRWSGKEAVNRAVEEKEAKDKRAKILADVKATGTPILDRAPAYGLHSKNQPCRLSATGIKPERHTGETCHAVYLEPYNDGVVDACTKPSRHLPDGVSKVKLTKAKQNELASNASSPAAGDAEKNQRRVNKQLREVRQSRRGFVRTLLSDTGITALTEADLVDLDTLALRTSIAHITAADEVALEILSVPREAGGTYYGQLERLVGVRDPRLLRIGCMASGIEESMVATWRRWDGIQRTYLTLLERFGRPMADPEHERLGDIRQEDGSWLIPEPDPEDVVEEIRCRVCGCSDNLACEGGCTWVDTDLCSTCSDATAAGLITEGQPLAEAAGV